MADDAVYLVCSAGPVCKCSKSETDCSCATGEGGAFCVDCGAKLEPEQPTNGAPDKGEVADG